VSKARVLSTRIETTPVDILSSVPTHSGSSACTKEANANTNSKAEAGIFLINSLFRLDSGLRRVSPHPELRLIADAAVPSPF
jgi:hypothetical protein